MNVSGVVSEYNPTLSQLKEFFSRQQPIVLKKGETFIDYGEQNRKLGILLKGLMYATYTAENGQEWISRFYYSPDNCIVSSHETFMNGQKSAESIRAYEDTELICVEKNEYDKLLDNNPKLEQLTRIIAEESYVQALKRIHTLQSLTASQRVKKFVQEHAGIVSRVQRQHVASYLGIHRNIFTRILNKL